MTAVGTSRVVLIMEKPGNLRVVEQALVRAGVLSMGVSSEAELQSLFETAFVPDLALVDVSGFGSSVWRMCESLQARQLPFIVLSQPRDAHASARSLQYGASSILEKPVARSALLQLIQSLSAQRQRPHEHEQK